MENKALIQQNGNGGSPSKTGLAINVSEFVRLVHAGIEAWEQAGQILVQLRNEDPSVFQRITSEYEFITMDALEIFYAIGMRTLYPLVMLLPKHICNTVRTMRYDAQKKVCTEPIQIVSRMVGDKPVIERKSVAKLSERECKRALFPKGNRSIEWQIRDIQRPEAPLMDLRDRVFKAPPIAARVPKTVATYSVRRAIGGKDFVFEKTMANTASNQRILLSEGQAVIELTEYKD